jgi:hypothetical protein
MEFVGFDFFPLASMRDSSEFISVSFEFPSDERDAKHAIDFGSFLYVHMANVLNSWLCYAFKGTSASVSHCVLYARLDRDRNHPRTWVIEGSMDGREWTEPDR